MRYDYRCFSSKLTLPDFGAYTSYGISASLSGSDIATIPDITTDHAKLKMLARLCNEFHLDLIHFRDVVEDFLLDL